MDRRKFISRAAKTTGLTASMLLCQRLGFTAYADENPLILVTFQAGGGWDPTFLFTPKPSPMSPYSLAEAKKIGPFTIAPSSDAFTDFVTSYKDKMLVINGIDSGSNDHFVASRYFGSGRMIEGFPHIGALWASIAAPQRPLAFASGVAGFSATENLIALSPLLNKGSFDSLMGGAPKQDEANQQPLIANVTADRLNRYGRSTRLSLREQRQIAGFRKYRNFDAGMDKVSGIIKNLETNLPLSNPSPELNESIGNSVRPALAYIAAGTTVAVSFGAGFFDTHWDHNNLHPKAISLAFQCMDYFLRGAALLGFADRTVVLMGSEFGRTPTYSDDNGKGKGHWPITSAILMGPGIPGGKVVGQVDDKLNPLKVNGSTLALDDNGVTLRPEHIHLALRQLLNIAEHKVAQGFPLVADRIKLFG